MTLRVLIADDEPLAREGVALSLEAHPDIVIVASCDSGSEAIRGIRERVPDLVLLDVTMPGLSGFDVIDAIGADAMPPVIFLTAHEHHALRAFRVAAIDYLLKPIDARQLDEALDRARRMIASQVVVERANELSSALEQLPRRSSSGREGRIVVRSGGRIHFLRPEEILWVEASGDYVTLHTRKQQYLVREAMHTMELRLAAYDFKRVHRSSLVCLESIKELEFKDGGDSEVVLENGTRLKVGRAHKDALLDSLKARD